MTNRMGWQSKFRNESSNYCARGDYVLKTRMSVNVHAALLSQFAKAGGFFDRLVETCPMRLTSSNVPEVRDLIATVMVSMVYGVTRFRHFDRLHGMANASRLFAHPVSTPSSRFAELCKFVPLDED